MNNGIMSACSWNNCAKSIMMVPYFGACFKETLKNVTMSHSMGKQTICICENKDADQVCGYRKADQRLCFHYTDSILPLHFKSKILSF